MSLVNNSANNFKDFLDAIKPYLNYQFYDMSGQGVEANNFSTDEKVIGTWIDGKPLYQKTIDFGAMPNNSTKGVQSNISNLDIVVDIVCCAKESVTIGTGTTLVVNTIIPTVYKSSDASNNVGIQIENGEIRISTTANDSGRYAYVTLKYTKTTDSPVASGEKIVGQWIDGKPVYEKVIDCGALPNNTTKEIVHGISNIDKVINIKGIAINASANTYLNIPTITINPSLVNYQIGMDVNNTYVRILTGIDRSSYSAYVTLQYTKTT